ncbi:MAG: hypothetical protein EOP53_23080, partial [Sphingobacteriales bacterium]
MRVNFKLFLFFFILLSAYLQAAAQQYNFYNYSVNDGLIQSQVSGIVQDKQGHLWVSSEGGVSRFDGKKFTQFTTAEGLISNNVYSMACDARGRMWFGTDKGICIFDAVKFTTLKLGSQRKDNVIKQLKAAANGKVYALAAAKLYDLSSLRPKQLRINGDTSIKITSIGLSPSGTLWCGTLNKGIFKLSNNGWLRIPYPADNKKLLWGTGAFLFYGEDKFLVATNNGIYNNDGKQLFPYQANTLQAAGPVIASSLQKDAEGNTWIGQPSGALMLDKEGNTTVFNAKNGFSDSRTINIFCDRDENVWLATDGQGIFRY